MTVEAYPLQWPQGWPRTPSGQQERGWQFKQTRYATPGQNWSGAVGKSLVTFAKARDQLYEELRKLGATRVVVATNHKPDKYGIPVESKRSVGDEGVAVYFQLKDRGMAMACDRFDNAAANMRSLGLAIEAMRQLERHGGGTMMERAFSGFVAIEAPGKSWWDVIEVRPDATKDVIEANFRRLARDRHPDRGGSNEAMAVLNEARAAGLAARP
jgi:hypothetical protein